MKKLARRDILKGLGAAAVAAMPWRARAAEAKRERSRIVKRLLASLTVAAVLVVEAVAAAPPPAPGHSSPDLAWPAGTKESRPWAYWWWMGSAVDEKNLTGQLETYRRAGMGGVHIVPIYGAKGYEKRYIEYLSPRWMAMLRHAVAEGKRLGLGVDMTTGTGWCFGGPNITERLANARVRHSTHKLQPGKPIAGRFGKSHQAVVAYGPGGRIVDLTDRIGPDGRVGWVAPAGEWTLWAVWQQPSGRKVKRAAPGGEGHMLNPFCGEAIRTYLKRFDRAFAGYKGPMPRAMYHDSFEYQCDWSPDLFAEFEKRRGYRLQAHLPALFGRGEAERIARVKYDYRRTVSDMMVENFARTWVTWAHQKGSLTRNQAHGSPGNLLDLYAEADIPETEFFRFDRNPLVAKFASSAAHVAGRKHTASETATWLAEHFHVTLGHLKPFIDGLFVSGVNHVIYHGTCYSPADAPWPGWLFYASTQMNPRNAIWQDAPALNAYIARCQAVLQAGRPDSDLLLYWPVHDFWHAPKGMTQGMSVHHVEWVRDQPIGKTASRLWRRGFGFDYVSDRGLGAASASPGRVKTAGGTCHAVLVPPCRYMPLETMRALHRLAEAGATIVFETAPPTDVPGLARLEPRREALRKLLGELQWKPVSAAEADGRAARIGLGRFIAQGDLEKLLDRAGVLREPMVDREGVYFIRRRDDAGRYYFITNQHKQFIHNPQTPPVDAWVPLAAGAKAVGIMDPLTGRTGRAATRTGAGGRTEVYLQLEPGRSLILRTSPDRPIRAPRWTYRRTAGPPVVIGGRWQVKFLQGGPKLPAAFQTDRLESWTKLGDDEARRFAGTARYTLGFDAPRAKTDLWRLDLGRVAESARVRLNGQDLGTVFCQPFAVDLPPGALKPGRNVLEIDVTNLSANRIRDLDRRGVKWRNFHNINVVNIDYRPFDASKWPIRDSGLLGPVRLIPQNVRTVGP